MADNTVNILNNNFDVLSNNNIGKKTWLMYEWFLLTTILTKIV